MPRRARTLMTVVRACGVLVLTCCSSPSPPAGGGGASRVRLGRPRGRPSCPLAVGCEPRPPWVCPSERVLVRAGSPCRIPRTWPDEAGIGWRQTTERRQPIRTSVRQRETTDWRRLTNRWTSLVQHEPARTGVTAPTDARRRQPMDCCHLASTGVNPLTGTGWSAPMPTSVKRCGPASTGGTALSGTCRHEPTKRPQMASTSGTASGRTGSCRAPERQSTGGWQAPEHQGASGWRAPAHRRTRAPAHRRQLPRPLTAS